MIPVSIGGSPSSGSTLLADLVDSAPGAVCGPEVRLFSPPKYFSEDEVMGPGRWYARVWPLSRTGRAWYSRFPRSATPSCYCGPLRLELRQLHNFGFDLGSVERCWRASGDFPSFARAFLRHFAEWRNKPPRIGAEKTPQNVQTATAFLERFPEGRFVHTVRDPTAVFRSLRRRGFPPYLAAATWVIETAAGWRVREHERCHTVRYEEVVKDPFGVVCGLLSEWGEEVTPKELEMSYRDNRYRERVTARLASWRHRDYGLVGDDGAAPAAMSDSELRALAQLATCRIGSAYAQATGLPTVDALTVAADLGYRIADPGADRAFDAWEAGSDDESRERLSSFWAMDREAGVALVDDPDVYRCPIVCVEEVG